MKVSAPLTEDGGRGCRNTKEGPKRFVCIYKVTLPARGVFAAVSRPLLVSRFRSVICDCLLRYAAHWEALGGALRFLPTRSIPCTGPVWS